MRPRSDGRATSANRRVPERKAARLFAIFFGFVVALILARRQRGSRCVSVRADAWLSDTCPVR